jgi:hypothetical protein
VHQRQIENLLREQAPQVLGAVVRRYGHFDLAEDACRKADRCRRAMAGGGYTGQAISSKFRPGAAKQRSVLGWIQMNADLDEVFIDS